MDMAQSSNRIVNSFPPLNNITPFTRIDGWSFLEVLEGLRNYVVNVLVKDIDDRNNTISEQLNQWFADYTQDFQDVKTDWQNLFDQFMADIVAQLEILNDQAIANLINNELSEIRKALDVKYEPRYRSDTNAHYVSHDLFNINGVGNEYTKLTNALNTIPVGSVLTIPESMTIDLGDQTLTITRPVGLRGGRLKSTADKVVLITSGNTSLENIKITGNGVLKGYLINQETVGIIGQPDAYIENIIIRNVHVNDVRDSGIYTRYCRNMIIEECTVKDYAYAGIAIRSTDNFVIMNCETSDLITTDGLHDRWGYGISISDSAQVVTYRSRNGRVYGCVVRNVRRGAGIETHGGYDIEFTRNRVYGCRNSFTLTTGNDTRQFTAEKCRILDNYVDADGYDNTTLSNGVSLGGGSDNSPYSSDCIVMFNTFVNTTRPVSYPPAYRDSPFMDRGKSVVAFNVSDNVDVSEMESTNFTTGWLPIETVASLRSGYTSNPGIPLMVRITHDFLGYHVEINGVAGLANPPATSVEILKFNKPVLYPPIKLMLGLTRTVDALETAHLSIEPDGMLVQQFPGLGAEFNRNVVLHGRWDCKVGRWDGVFNK